MRNNRNQSTMVHTLLLLLRWLLLVGRCASFVPSYRRALLRQPNQLSSVQTQQDEVLLDKLEKEHVLETIMNPGIPDGFFVIKEYNSTLQDGFVFEFSKVLSEKDSNRLDLSPSNVTLPVALMLLDPTEYPSLSRARKACRKGTILIHRNASNEWNTTNCIRGRVGDFVLVGDVVAQQVRMGSGRDTYLEHRQQEPPPYELPVTYQDDYFAIVNKPAGVASRERGTMSVRAALPFVLTPPQKGVVSVMRRPQPVHRLDKPTSGLLLIAKTKPAMVNLSAQFLKRTIKKTYTAIVNGIPQEPVETRLSSRQAHKLGVDVDPNNDKATNWQLIDYTLDEKDAITVWRVLGYSSSLKANDGTLTLVELKPKTGRFHQLRRHFAWARGKPLVGDKQYDESTAFRHRGLFLCSNRVVLEHPYYNTDEGRKEWELLPDDKKFAHGMLKLSNGKVIVQAEIELPGKFQSLLNREHERSSKLDVTM